MRKKRSNKMRVQRAGKRWLRQRPGHGDGPETDAQHVLLLSVDGHAVQVEIAGSVLVDPEGARRDG